MFVLCLSIVHLSGHRVLLVILINLNLFKDYSQKDSLECIICHTQTV